MANKIESSRAHLLSLHTRVLSGDRAALEEMAAELWLPLYNRLQRAFPRIAFDFVADATTDALLAYATRPNAFDIKRLVPLDHFLYGIAARILRDRQRSEQRRTVRDADYGECLLQAYGPHGENRADSHLTMQRIRYALPSVCDSVELAAMVAWLDEDDTGAVAVCLGLSHLSCAEKRREVRRFTERITKRLRRLLGSSLPTPRKL